MTLAPLAVAVEIRTLETGPRLRRAFRLSESVGEGALRLEHDLPFEPGRPVTAELTLPDDLETPLSVVGVVADARGITFTSVPAETRMRLARYVKERMLAS